MKKKLVLAISAIILSIAVFGQEVNSNKPIQKTEVEVLQAELINKLYAEKDGARSELIAAEIVKKIDTDPSWAAQKTKRDMYRVMPLYAYLHTEDFEGFKRLLAKLGEVTGTERIHFATAGYVRRVVKKGIDLDFASQLIQKEREWAKKKMLEVPLGLEDGRESAYALFTTDYAQLLYAKGEKAKAYELMKEAMKYNRQRKDADLTNFYLTVAAELLPQDKLKKEMETLKREGMSTAGTIERLKVIYVKEKGRETGFENYIASFNTDKVKAKMEALRSKVLNETAPDFSLKDLNGAEINLKDLKGKTIVLDFWATWCGPCKASFPAMQVMVNKYKNDPNVQFLFIDTYERGDNKEKNAGDFMKEKKYTFHVLMDNEDKMAKDYKAKNIPAKFIIDKTGKLRFSVTGFKNDAELMEELEAMIKLSSEQE